MSAVLSLFTDEKVDSTSQEDMSNDNISYVEAFLQCDLSSCSTRQLLIAIFETYYPIEQAKRYMTSLFEEFGSFTGIINASYELLKRVAPVTREIWIRLQIIRVSVSLTLREAIQDQPILGNLDAVTDYLTFTIGHEKVESVRILYLTSKNRLLRDELHAKGTSNFTTFYPREIIKRACELRSNGLIIAHNHPSGDPTPSKNDIEATSQINQILHALGITFCDHVIVGKHRTFSFRASGLLI